MIYAIYSYCPDAGIVIQDLDVDFNKARYTFISMAPEWTRIDGGENGLNFIEIDLDTKSTLNLLNNLYTMDSDKYAYDKDMQSFLSKLFEQPTKTFVANFLSEDVIAWLEEEKDIDGFEALELSNKEWDEYVKEYINTIV